MLGLLALSNSGDSYAWTHGSPGGAGPAACPTNGPTLPGLNCDTNGWTIFTPTPDPSFTTWAAQEGTGYNGTGTRIIYVSSSRGSNAGCNTSSPPVGCTNTGSFLSPFATLFVAGQFVRNNSPDYVLADCNDTFTDGYGGANSFGGGPDNGHPAVYGIFDKNIYSTSVAPDPDPPSCPHQVNVNITQALSAQSLGSFFGGQGFRSTRFNHTALVGYNFYCQDRDPIGSGYNLTNAAAYTSGAGVGYTDDGALFENNTFRFCGGLNGGNTCLGCLGQQGFYSRMTNIYVRRNVIYGNYPNNANAEQGLAVIPAGGGFNYFENLVDQNGWSTDAAATWAPRNQGFGRNLYIQFYGVNGDPASLGVGVNFSGNTLAENTTGGEQWRPGNSTYEDNLLVQEPGVVTNGLNTMPSATGNWLRNVFTDESNFTGGADGMQFNPRYLFGLSNSLTSSTINASNNFFVNSPATQGAGDYAICIGCLNNNTVGGFVGLTANGNVTYDFAAQNSGSAYKRTTGGVVCTTNTVYGGCQVSAGGSGYTDNFLTFTSTCSTSAGINTALAAQFTGALAPSTVTFTAAATGTNQITVTLASGYIAVPTPLSGTGVPGGTQIVSQVSGTPNGNGVYQLGATATWSSTTVTAGYQVFTLTSTAAGTIVMFDNLYALTPTAVQYGFYPVSALISGSLGANGSTYWINPQFGRPIVTTGTQTFYEGCGNDDGQNYISANVVSTTNAYNSIANTGNCYYQFSSGSDTTLHGPFSCGQVLNNPTTHITIWGSTWTAGMGALGGKVYYPWYATKMSVTGAGTSSTCNASAPPKMELISVGTHIVFAGIGGSDNSWGSPSLGGGSEQADDPSDSCTTGDTITVTSGASCANAPDTALCSFPSGGSGLAVKVDQVSTTTFQTTGCNPASNNVDDPTGKTCTAFTDPGRSIGAYYGTQIAGSTANCTFTASVAAPVSNIAVMTVTVPNSCALTVGDGLTWGSQTKAAVIAGDSTHNSSLCGTACTGTGSNTGTYALNTVSNTGASGGATISDWQSIQFVKAQRLNQKQSPWNPKLTSCDANTWMMAGWGVTNTCQH